MRVSKIKKWQMGGNLTQVFSLLSFKAQLRGCFIGLLAGMMVGESACTLFVVRPVQEMSDTVAALRAAKEVQADILAPEMFQQANEWFFKAKHEYKFKNFSLARDYTNKARHLAEEAEFAALRNGGMRSEGGVVDPLSAGAEVAPPSGNSPGPQPSVSPYAYPTPLGTPADVYEERKAEDEARKYREWQMEHTTEPSPQPPSGRSQMPYFPNIRPPNSSSSPPSSQPGSATKGNGY